MKFIAVVQFSALCAISLAWACGPTTATDTNAASATSGGQTGDSSTGGVPQPQPTTAATSANTTLSTTSQPGDTTSDPPDTGPTATDGSPPDLPEDCSILEQDCPPGYKCMPFATDGNPNWNDTMCVEVVEDPSLPGEPCTVQGSAVSGIDDCDATSMCWNVDPKTNEGTCVEQCTGTEQDPTCPDQCDRCTTGGDSILWLCLGICDPIIQNCMPGSGCYPINDSFSCAPDASPAGTGLGSACEFINVCPPGMFCLSADVVPDCQGSAGCCAPVCPANGADPCPGLLPGTECVPWYEDGSPHPEACVADEPGVCVIAPG
ncbi:MAG: hypothetical protein K0V04_07400 [Deltaproteobacteria bacterium]|nr:hypothetical protein [Deltaproteobacteria bacterium]